MKNLHKSIVVLVAMMATQATTAIAGDVTTIYERSVANEEGITVWSDADKDGVSEDSWLGNYSDITISESGLELKALLKTEKIITKSISPSAGTILTFDFVWEYPYHNTYNQDGAYTNIKIGNNIEFINEKSAGSSYVINGTKTKYTSTLADTKVRIHVVVNTAMLKLTDLSITKVSDETVLLDFASVPDELKTLSGETTFTQLSIGAKHTTNKNEGRYTRTVFESIKVQQETQEVATYGYTVNYKEGEQIVKTLTGAQPEGTVIPVLNVIEVAGETEEDPVQKYLRVEDKDTVQLVTTDAENNVLDIAVRRPYQTTLSVYRQLDGVKADTAFIVKQLIETDDKKAEWVYTFPLCEQIDSVWYRTSLKNDMFGETGTFANEPVERVIEYTSDPEIFGFWDYSHKGIVDNPNYSGGSMDTYTKEQAIDSIPAGTYELTVMQTGNFGANLYRDFVNSDDRGELLCSFNSEERTQEFVLISDTLVNLRVYTGSNGRYDYVLLKKLDVKYPYVVNYVAGEDTVYTVESELLAGDTIAIAKTVDGEGAFSGRFYLLVDDELPQYVVKVDTVDQVFTINVREPYSTKLKVYRTFDGEQETEPFFSRNLLETDDKVANWSYVFSRYAEKDGKYYLAELKDGKYGEQGTFTNEPVNCVIDYKLDSTVVFFAELGTQGNDLIYSGGAIAAEKEYAIATLPAATYEVTLALAEGSQATLYNGEEAVAILTADQPVAELKLTEQATALRVAADSNIEADYLVVRKTADYVPPTPTGIKTVSNMQSTTHTYYDLQGRKLATNRTQEHPKAKGLYIVNGKKVVK